MVWYRLEKNHHQYPTIEERGHNPDSEKVNGILILTSRLERRH